VQLKGKNIKQVFESLL